MRPAAPSRSSNCPAPSAQRGLVEARPALTKAVTVVKDLFVRIDWLKVAKHAGGLGFTALSGLPSPDQLQSLVGLIGGFRKDPAALLTKENADAAVEQLSALIKPAEPKNVPEEIEGFRRAFENLLKQAGIDQLTPPSCTGVASVRRGPPPVKRPADTLWVRCARAGATGSCVPWAFLAEAIRDARSGVG